MQARLKSVFAQCTIVGGPLIDGDISYPIALKVVRDFKIAEGEDQGPRQQVHIVRKHRNAYILIARSSLFLAQRVPEYFC